MNDFTGYYDDRLPAGWREYDERDEYQAQIAGDLAPDLAERLAAIPADLIW
jgi:hypothetical protein